MVKVRTIHVKGGSQVQCIEASWDSGQWVAIICSRGMVGCGAFDVKLMEEHEQVIAVARGSVGRHLVSGEDLLGARICGVTKLARQLGVEEGMTGREAVELLSGGGHPKDHGGAT
ncbi:MAG: DUF1805 domain-containing protein [Candidatus Lokiarchaeota archaeon]|nr:DUF1805 domain-containing protein [Candidatus Lokiarchaeota archaeon]